MNVWKSFVVGNVIDFTTWSRGERKEGSTIQDSKNFFPPKETNKRTAISTKQTNQSKPNRPSHSY